MRQFTLKLPLLVSSSRDSCHHRENSDPRHSFTYKEECRHSANTQGPNLYYVRVLVLLPTGMVQHYLKLSSYHAGESDRRLEKTAQ